MINLPRLTAAMILSVGLSACASSSFDYTPPSYSSTPKNELVLNEAFDKVWDRLVKNLSADFFVINNIEKASRLINVSFASDKPSDFVDCGRTKRTFGNATGEHVYRYASADSAYYTAANPQGYAFNVSRRTSLEGRANIYVAPEGQQTVVRVNTRYVVSIKLDFQQLGGPGRSSDSLTWRFDTKKPYENYSSQTGVTVKCVSVGTIEKKVLDAAR